MSVRRDSSIANGPALTVPSCISRCNSTPPSSGLTIQLKPRSVTSGGIAARILGALEREQHALEQLS